MPNNEQLRICFFASHGGSNMQAIIDAIKANKINAIAALIISNNSSSFALERAKNEGIPAYHLSSKTNPDDLDDKIIEKMQMHKVNIVVLAGYMKKLNEKIIDFVKGRVLNIHPALLPKFGGRGMYGMNVHKAVIESGEEKSGPTVHLVNSKYDEGRILKQMEVPVLKNDTPDELAARVLEKEHIIYAQTIKEIAEGKIEI